MDQSRDKIFSHVDRLGGHMNERPWLRGAINSPNRKERRLDKLRWSLQKGTKDRVLRYKGKGGVAFQFRLCEEEDKEAARRCERNGVRGRRKVARAWWPRVRGGERDYVRGGPNWEDWHVGEERGKCGEREIYGRHEERERRRRRMVAMAHVAEERGNSHEEEKNEKKNEKHKKEKKSKKKKRKKHNETRSVAGAPHTVEDWFVSDMAFVTWRWWAGDMCVSACQ